MTDTPEHEKTFWTAVYKLHNNMDAAGYKHAVLGLIFLKYISDAFDELITKLDKATSGADPKDKDEYAAKHIFCVPLLHVGSGYKVTKKCQIIGKDIDDANGHQLRDHLLPKLMTGKIEVKA